MTSVLLATATLRAQPQLTQAQINSLTPLDPAAVPRCGTFWLLNNPWPGCLTAPLPCPPADLPNAPIYALGDDQFLVDNTPTARAALSAEALVGQALDAVEMQFNLEERLDGAVTLNSAEYTADDLWLDIAGLTNATGCFVIHPPQAEAANGVYDLFMTTNLTARVSGLNLTNWLWVLRTDPGQTNLVLTNMPSAQAFFILGRTNDTDADGLTDAFEQLVSHSNPTNPATAGLPDLWEWENFGNCNQAPDADYDGNGRDNSLEWSSQRDPNTIQFSITIQDPYVSTTAPNIPFAILSGVPASMSVLVNQTDFSNAVWQPFSWEVPVSLSGGDGAYTVWVGLRGRRTNSEQTWHGVTLTLDTTPPAILVARPPATVSQPVIQLRGSVSENLSRFTYDLANAAGLATNQPVLITGAHLNTNATCFTSDFQAYDVPLTNGLNTLTLRATDLAGNVSTTNIAITLDYSSDTTPPGITLEWPQTNTVVAGASCTLIGTVDDPTATVLVIGSESQTNVAVVERSGRFFVSGLPLAESTNTFAVIATDAAGNSRTSRVAVVRSAVAVSLNPPSTAQFSQYASTAAGIVSDTNCDVWVNGVRAEVHDDNTWTAGGVPVTNTDGTGQFEIALYPKGSDPALTSPIASQNSVVSMPSVVRPVGYRNASTYYRILNDCRPISGTITHQTWELGVGGTWSYQGWADPSTVYSTPWPAEYLPVSLWQNISSHLYRASWYSIADCGVGWDIHAVDQTTETRLELAAKGPAQSGEWRFIRLTASAWTCSDPLDSNGFGHPDTPQPASLIRLQGELMTPTATNDYVGEMFVLAQAGSRQSVSFSVDGASNPTIEPKAEDVAPHIFFGTNDVTSLTNIVFAGQEIRLYCRLPSTNIQSPSYRWAVPGNAISNFVVSADFFDGTVYTDFPTGNSNVVFHWIDGGTRQVTCSIGGEQGPSASTTFEVRKPTADWNAVIQGTVAVDTNYMRSPDVWVTKPCLHFGVGSTSNNAGVRFSFSNADLKGYAGDWAFRFVQLGSMDERFNFPAMDPPYSLHLTCTNALDMLIADYVYESWTNATAGASDDTPSYGPLRILGHGWRTDVFQSYLLWEPLEAGAVPVPLKVAGWTWGGEISTNGSPTNFVLVRPFPVPSSEPARPAYSLPTWTSAIWNPLVVSNGFLYPY